MIYQPPPPSRKLISERGMSLIEMMVAVSIIWFLALMVAPEFENIVMPSRLSSQTNDLISTIQAARGEAIKRNQQIRLCRTASATSTNCAGAGNWEFWIVVNPAGTVLRRGGVLRNRADEPLLTLTSTLNQGTLIFLPNGMSNVTSDDNGSIEIVSPTGEDKNARRLIATNLAGRVSIIKCYRTGDCPNDDEEEQK